MNVRKKKYGFWVLMGLIALWGGYLVSGIMPMEITIHTIGTAQKKLEGVLRHPFLNYWNAYSLRCMGIAALIWILAFMVWMSKQRNYMFGREYGSSRWAKPKALTRKLTQKGEESFGTRILSQDVKMSLNTRHTQLNNNLLIIGGPGTGKSMYEVTPNGLECNSSYIFTDPKGELQAKLGNYLKSKGYVVKSLNLVEMEESDGYNPFVYVQDDTDVTKLITNLIANTTPKKANVGDPFWEKSESLYLQALFYYVWKEFPIAERNFNSLLKLLSEAEVREDGSMSELDQRMELLAAEKGENHPAVSNYRKCIRGAGDTVRSIIISANSRLAFFSNPKLQMILEKDDMNIPFLGCGVEGDQKTKTVLFCVIPDTDKTYNFMAGLLYTQIFQRLYYCADHIYNGPLPIAVDIWMDEFANVALPDDFCSLLSTMRSRNIYCSIILQNLVQIKTLFKEGWGAIPGSCSTLVYLGGNDQETHKFVSEALGKQTIDKKSSGETKGQHGSSSQNFDILGRELLTPSEVRKLPRNKCIILIDGEDPVLDQKYRTFKTEKYKVAVGLGLYHHEPGTEKIAGGITLLKEEESLEYYRKLSKKQEQITVSEVDLVSFLKYDFSTKASFCPAEIENIMKTLKEEPQDSRKAETDGVQTDKTEAEEELFAQIFSESYSEQQRTQIILALENKIPEETVQEYLLHSEYSPEKMEQIRRVLILQNI